MNEYEELYNKLILRSGRLIDNFSEELAEELNLFSNDCKVEVLKNLEITILNKIYTSSYEKHYMELCDVVKKLLEEKDRI